ncbi:hypothetical protein E0Z10_g9234 [Xylaria hypoxylon]|uniref:Uncharacterized protein n=1 Tax=Xylaria hypoxylon TaxID=37992 RepID=A0A4Z0Y9B0_9PEZI|nr:hypothetical protein E0Z10_g9234 [Xylaria hypoxylon]
MPVLDALWQRQAATILQRTSARARRPLISPLSHSKPQARTRIRNRRFQSTDSKPSPNSNPNSTTPKTHRISQILTSASRFLPKRLQTSLQNLRSAPISHVGAFLILHEITAILPIFGLTYAFYAFDWVPTSWVLGPFAGWAEDGLKKYAPYFRKKHWFGLKDKDKQGTPDGEEALENELREEVRREQEREVRDGKKGWFAKFSGKRVADTSAGDSESTTSSGEGTGEGKNKNAAVVWRKVKQAATVDNTEKGYKIGIQIAAAYAITKFLLVPRIALSLWLTPWLARGFVGFRQAMRRKRS